MRRLLSWDYSGPAGYFITFVTYKRRKILGRLVNGKLTWTPAAYICQYYWRQLAKDNTSCALDAFVVMPDHVHGIIWIKDVPRGVQGSLIHESANKWEKSALSRRHMMLGLLIGKFKMQAAKYVNLLNGTTGSSLWKKGYYERIIRNDHALWNIRAYIANNSKKWEKKYGRYS